MAQPENDTNIEITTNRLEAFSDGVFAIAITLLILDLKLPEKKVYRDEKLQSLLLELWPGYLAYALSFLIIGIYWAHHHYIFKFYSKTDHTFLILNLFFLMSISFLPFPTSILGEFIVNISNRGTSVTLYSLGLFLPAFFWFMIWLYANHNQKLIDHKLSKKFIRYLSRLYLLVNILYLSSIVISLFFPAVSVILSVALTLLFMLPPKKPEYQDV